MGEMESESRAPREAAWPTRRNTSPRSQGRQPEECSAQFLFPKYNLRDAQRRMSIGLAADCVRELDWPTKRPAQRAFNLQIDSHPDKPQRARDRPAGTVQQHLASIRPIWSDYSHIELPSCTIGLERCSHHFNTAVIGSRRVSEVASAMLNCETLYRSMELD